MNSVILAMNSKAQRAWLTQEPPSCTEGPFFHCLSSMLFRCTEDSLSVYRNNQIRSWTLKLRYLALPNSLFWAIRPLERQVGLETRKTCIIKDMAIEKAATT